MSEKRPEGPMELKIQLDEKTADGTYANCVGVFHNQAEFVMDFGRIVPGRPEVKVQSRLITNPIAFKQILMALQENLSRYEAAFGPVPVEPPRPVPRGFVQ